MRHSCARTGVTAVRRDRPSSGWSENGEEAAGAASSNRAPQAQLGDETAVPLDVLPIEVVQEATSLPDQKVLVQHKVPRVIADLVRGQFHLMQEWLRPILSESIDNSRDLEQLKQQLETVMATYQEVENSFESAGPPSKPAST